MRDRLAGWLRRLANRLSPPAVAGARAGFIAVNAKMAEDELRYMQRREAWKHYHRP